MHVFELDNKQIRILSRFDIMIKVPGELHKKYNRLLANSDFSPGQYAYCRKWLRYYLDFCKKYHNSCADEKSLLLFLGKLEDRIFYIAPHCRLHGNKPYYY